MNETVTTEKGALPDSEPLLREKRINQLITFATFATSARLIQENELTVMQSVYGIVLTNIPTDELIPAVNLTISARIASGNTYPITPIEIASRWNRRTTEVATTSCSHCEHGFIAIRKPGERPEVIPCPHCNL